MVQRYFVKNKDGLYLAGLETYDWITDRAAADLYTEDQLKPLSLDGATMEKADTQDFFHWCGRRGGRSRSPAKMKAARANMQVARAKRGKKR